MAIPTVLTIGGSDSAGLTGVQADLRTFAALRCHGASALTLITAQTTGEVRDVAFLPPAIVDAQIRAVFDDLHPRAVKVGALGSAETITQVAGILTEICTVPIVVDPFCVTRGGDVLLDDAGIAALKERLIPIASVVTPNLAEAALLTGMPRAQVLGDMLEQGNALVSLGVRHALITGGHGQAEQSTDILVSEGRPDIHLRAPRVDTPNVRGLSDTLTAAIAAHIAHDLIPYESIQFAKVFVSSSLDGADQLSIGAGPGPVHQMVRLWERPGGDDETG